MFSPLHIFQVPIIKYDVRKNNEYYINFFNHGYSLMYLN